MKSSFFHLKHKEKIKLKNPDDIVPMEEDFAKWYTSVITKARLVSYSGIRGCMILEPYGYAIWENIQKILDSKFKETGHQNVYMPMFVPESLLNKEKAHVEGFSPEVAWVTHGGSEALPERMCIRPTSETLFCEYYSRVIKSYRDLPKLYNQWCSVVRWEKTTRPFLRSLEFLWQEGHTAHASIEEANKEAIDMLNLYENFCKGCLAISVIKGKKTDSEKFAGAEITYTIESMMQDGKALQTATTHYFADRFAKAFDIQFLNENNELRHVFQSSWGLTTRVIGAVIMVHGDNKGLKLPPKIAPIQIVIIPIASYKKQVLEKANELYSILKEHFKVKLDVSDKSPGWKYSEYEMLGVPIRLEIGPRDIEKNEVTLARRDTRDKFSVSFKNIIHDVTEVLSGIQKNMLKQSKEYLDKRIKTAKNFEELKKIIEIESVFIKSPWCGNSECEKEIKEKTTLTSRCIVSDEDVSLQNCVLCGKEAKYIVYWAIAY